MSSSGKKIELDLEFAQEVCDTVAKHVGYGVIIALENGIIKAASAKNRIGDIHDGAAKIMRHEQDVIEVTAEMAAASEGMKEGANAAVDISGERYCSVGIAAPVEEARKFLALIRFCVDASLRSNMAELREKERLAVVIEENISNRITKITDLVTSLNGMSGVMSDQMQQTCEKGHEASTLTQQNNDTIAIVASAATELGASVQQISTRMDETSSISKTAVDEGKSASAHMNGLGDKIKEIGQFVSVVQNISSQTNLLALNATIEAARAGDAGKGFAVVAQEVKSLANETAKATKSIELQVKDIQDETTVTIDIIDQINQTIERINELSAATTTAINEQNVATSEIARSAETVAGSSSIVAENITDVITMAENTAGKVEEVKGVAAQLQKEYDYLTETLDDVQTQLRNSDQG